MDAPAQLSEDYVARFGGIGRLYGLEAMARLARAHVCVVGVGGVGSWTVEALARSGVGQLTLIDLDDVCVNNSNRQLHTLHSTIGQQKVDVLASRARDISPECQITPVSDFFTAATAEELLSTDYDWVVDAIDHVDHKALLLARCRARGLKAVCVGGAGGRADPTRLEVDDLSRSAVDGLLRNLRHRLRHAHDFPRDAPWNIPCVFSREHAVYPTPDGGVCDSPPAGTNARLDCATGFGAATFVTGAAGFMAAGVVVSALARGREPVLARLVDALGSA